MPRSLRLVAVLDNIRSLYNVGSMFRTADAFGVEHLYLCGMTGDLADPLTKARVHKTALGAEDLVPWSYNDSLSTVVDELKKDGFTIVALEQTPTAQSLFDRSSSITNHELSIALVLGHELYGVSERALAAADQYVQIPMLGQKESLNVAVAFGIAVSWLRHSEA